MRDYELARENREAWYYIRYSGHMDFLNKAIECDNYVAGEQWGDVAKAKLRSKRKPILTINKLLATYAALKAEQLQRGGDISFRSSAGGNPETARIFDKLWLNFSYNQNREFLETMQFSDGVIRSRGFLDLRIDFDENMRGEPKLTYLNSKDVGLYPGDFGIDPDGWSGVLITRWLSPRDVAEIYRQDLNEILQFADTPELDGDLTDFRRDSFGLPTYSYQSITPEQRAKHRLLRVLERQEWTYLTKECFVDMQTGETREIPDTWDRERISLATAQFGYGVVPRRIKKINWVVSVGDMLLHSAISPYRHFTPILYAPFIIGGKTIGIVEQLRDPQNLLNKTLSQELHIVAGIANSGFKVRQGALANMTPEQLQDRGGEDGLVIEVNGDLSQVEKLKPNEVPTGLDRLSYTASEMMQQISLVNDSMQGLNRADEAGKAIERKAYQGSTALAPIFASLDQSRRILARNWLDLTQQYVTEERVYHIASKARTSAQQPVTVNQEQPDGSFLNDLTVGEYMIQVTDVQSRDTYDQNQFDIMMQMLRLGAPIPWSEVVNSLTILENKDEIVQFLKNQEGQKDPSEQEQQQQALQQRMMEAEALDKESSAQVKQAQAHRAMTEAKKALAGDDSSQIEMMKFTQQAQLKQQEQERKYQFDIQKAQIDAQIEQQRLQFEREKMQMELEFMRQENELKLEALRAKIDASAMQADVKRQTAEQDFALKQQTAQHDFAIKRQQSAMDLMNQEQNQALQSRNAELQLHNAEQTSAMKLKHAEQAHKQKLSQVPKPKTDNKEQI